MTVLLGRSGHVKLARGSAGPLFSTVKTSDLNLSLNRLGFDNAIDNLLTGDRVDIKTNDSRGLDFLPLPTWPTATATPKNFTAYINVNAAGGLRFFPTFADAVNNNRAQEYSLQSFAGDAIDISISTRDFTFNVLGNVSGYELNTEREDIDITTLSDKFRQRYSAGLISGSGQISTYFNYATTGIEETPLLLMQVIQRLDSGSKVDLALYLAESDTSPADNVYYEIEAMIVRSGVSVAADGIIEATIDFVSTGEIKLLVGAPSDYILKEDEDRIGLEQSLDYLLTEVED